MPKSNPGQVLRAICITQEVNLELVLLEQNQRVRKILPGVRVQVADRVPAQARVRVQALVQVLDLRVPPMALAQDRELRRDLATVQVLVRDLQVVEPVHPAMEQDRVQDLQVAEQVLQEQVLQPGTTVLRELQVAEPEQQVDREQELQQEQVLEHRVAVQQVQVAGRLPVVEQEQAVVVPAQVVAVLAADQVLALVAVECKIFSDYNKKSPASTGLFLLYQLLLTTAFFAGAFLFSFNQRLIGDSGSVSFSAL